MRTVLYLTATLLAVCAAIEAVRMRAIPAAAFALASLLIGRELAAARRPRK